MRAPDTTIANLFTIYSFATATEAIALMQDKKVRSSIYKVQNIITSCWQSPLVKN
jgi:hypothetical protein